jgi:hypothetical protein
LCYAGVVVSALALAGAAGFAAPVADFAASADVGFVAGAAGLFVVATGFVVAGTTGLVAGTGVFAVVVTGVAAGFD